MAFSLFCGEGKYLYAFLFCYVLFILFYSFLWEGKYLYACSSYSVLFILFSSVLWETKILACLFILFCSLFYSVLQGKENTCILVFCLLFIFHFFTLSLFFLLSPLLHYCLLHHLPCYLITLPLAFHLLTLFFSSSHTYSSFFTLPRKMQSL